jgi:FkbM family methyltransferase
VNVLDLGANIGLFDVHARGSLPIGHVATFEPDPNNAAVLERARDANGGSWEIVRACASNQAGTTTFQSGHHNLSRIGNDGDTTVPVVDVFPYLANADLVKMNIEGAEWDILQDERLAANTSAWIVEYHRINNPEGEISALVEEMFAHAGFTTRIVMRHNENGLVWAWKQR